MEARARESLWNGKDKVWVMSSVSDRQRSMVWRLWHEFRASVSV